MDCRIVTIILTNNTCDPDHNFDVHRREFGVKFGSDSLASPRCEAGVTHNVFAPRSFRRRVLHGRSGPCRFCYRPVLYVDFHRSPTRRPRSLGSDGLWDLRTSAVRTSCLLFLGLHLSLVRAPVDERACASAECGKVYPRSVHVRVSKPPDGAPKRRVERVTMSGLRLSLRHPA
jgi:hypothetical protein